MESGGKDNSQEEAKDFQVKETTTVIRGKDNEGRSTVNQYTIVRALGEGSYGKVKLCMTSEGDQEEYFGLKIFKKNLLRRKREYISNPEGGMKIKTAWEDVLREIAIMKKLHHTNIIKLFEVIDDQEYDKLYMVMEFASKGQILEWNEDDLVFYIEEHEDDDYGEERIRRMLCDIFKGLGYLHKNGIIHRDIKPQNLLMDDHGNVRIADFGVAQLFETDDDSMSKTEGTYHFLPPECCSAATTKFSGKAADVWAVGITMFALLFKKLPFYGENVWTIMEAIEKGELVIPNTRQISDGCRNLLSRLLEKDPDQRPTVEEVLTDPWLGIDQTETFFAVEVDADEIENAISPFVRVVKLKQIIKDWKRKTKEKVLTGGHR
mmetsp:Transcript_47516/g.54705  ORF Transcript_47516/g.54705 Transcript_47516/m.54705 type:complete len:377 (+) Transcript_47516:47-1177(+)